jgi:hypothetical protein
LGVGGSHQCALVVVGLGWGGGSGVVGGGGVIGERRHTMKGQTTSGEQVRGVVVQ